MGMTSKASPKGSNRVWQETEFLVSGLQSGESYRGICPKCLGGSTQEKSFLCSRDNRGIAYYICFRASCGYRGCVDALLGPGIGGEPKRKTHKLERPLEILSDDKIAYWRAKFDINPGSEVYWCPSTARFALRIYGPKGQHRGWILRDFNTQASKAIVYPEKEDGPFIGWFEPPEATDDSYAPVVIVEDLISARKVSDAGYRSVSLNGTNLGLEELYEIRGETDSIVLALDRGTMNLMLKYRQKYGLLFDDMVIWQLDKDLKYVSRRRIREAVEDGKPDFVSYPDYGK